MSQLFYSNLQSIIGENIPILFDSESVYLRFKCKYPEDETEYAIFIEQCSEYIRQQNSNIFLRIQEISERIFIFLQSTPQLTKIQILEMMNDSQYNKITIFLIELIYQLIQQFITDLIEKELNYEEFHEYTTDLLERAMCFFALEFREFAELDSRQLYSNLKGSFYSILQNIQQFLYKCSAICNQRMQQLNELLLKYSSLANVRSYEILQTETSYQIIQQITLTLQDCSFFFFRPEFKEYSQLIVTKSIRYFYDYSKQPCIQNEMSTLTNSFNDAIEMQELLFEFKGINLQENQQQFKLNHNQEYIKQQDYIKLKQERESLLANGQLAGDLYGGSIGTGIGCLIVDCTDKKMPWNQKLKRAGFSTISTGLVSVAMRLPVVGLIIQQAIIVYAVGYTVSNQVVSKEQKAKNLAHVSVQGATGMGSAIVGQMLIPIPVVGAIIGGTVGGVAISLYQRLVVQRNKPSIKVMLEKLLPRLQYDGLMYYDEKVLGILKINRNHFMKNQPAEFTDSQWLTILSVFLVNEIYYLHKLQIKEKYEDLQQKLEKKPNDKNVLKEFKQIDQEEEEMEIINVKWERCRILLDEMQFQILPFAELIGSFLNGMLQNFKI